MLENKTHDKEERKILPYWLCFIYEDSTDETSGTQFWHLKNTPDGPDFAIMPDWQNDSTHLGLPLRPFDDVKGA